MKPISLRSGPLTLLFEPESAFLRYVRMGDHEVVRAIYGAVRDRNWNTVPPNISNLRVDAKENHFNLEFDAECRVDEIHFIWRGGIDGDEKGRVVYRFSGEAQSDFYKNRIGLCVLHPILECAGKPCVVERVDGTVEQGVFPKYIAPHQPFKSVRSITHEVVPGVRAEVRFEGDTFEMEDQRNWTDASFKTYSTPLELPFPVRIEKGSRIDQTVAVSFPSEPRKILPILLGRPPQFSISTTPIIAKPPLGLCAASHGRPLTEREITRLKRLRLSHLRVDLRLSDDSYSARLRQAATEAAAIGAGLHIALHLSDRAEAELAAFKQQIEQTKPHTVLWMIFHVAQRVTDPQWVRRAREHLAAVFPNVLFAAGTDAYFAELNRNRPPVDSTALPCYSIVPQVHASDDRTLVENVAAQPDTIETARQFCRQSVVISPITLRPRFNPDATGEFAVSTAAAGKLPPDVDPRQMRLFAAGWTLASIARLASTGGLHSLTYYETTGPRGIMETEYGSQFPDLFPSQPGMVFPVYHLFALMAGYMRMCPTHSSHPLQTEGLTLLDEKNRKRILVANLLPELQEVKIKTGVCRARVRYLDETNAETMQFEPEQFEALPGEMVESVAAKIELQLKPHALAVVDVM